ncbi:hypothetical protein BSKO_12273 [Bryopsis sp. KO-2023]|nr:hypothetical protein BSKO_12273 [Bryopsis sp. KO-2023]
MTKPLQFVSSFCDDKAAPGSFGDLPNFFKKFTPCFIEIGVLGVSYVVAIILTLVRLRITKLRRTPQFKQRGGARLYQHTAVLASMLCIIVPIMQLGARLGETAIPLSPTGNVAPYEWPAFLLPIISWLLMTIIQVRELKRFTWQGLWTARFPLVLICAAQFAKLSFVAKPDMVAHDMFFWLYIVFVGLQGYLAIFAITHIPRQRNLQPVMEGGYTALDGSVRSSFVEASELDSHVCPEATAGLFSRLTFGWMGPLIRLGYKAPLEDCDVWNLPPGDNSAEINEVYQGHWQTEAKKPRKNNLPPSLVNTMVKTVGYLFLKAIPLKFISDISQLVGPLFLSLLLGVVENDEPKTLGYIYAVSMFCGLMLGTLSDNQHFQLVMRAGFRLRSILTTEVHRKSLYIVPTVRAKYSSGRMFNFVATDAESLQMLCMNLLGIISSPVRIAGAMVLLYLQLGPASMVALASLVLMVPIQAVIVKRTATFVKKAVFSTDERAKLEGELLSGIEVVKCNAWEKPLRKTILSVRKVELRVLWHSFVLSALNAFLLTSIPAIVAVVTFAVFIASGGELTAKKAFTSVTLFNVLRVPLFQLPQLITQLTQASVSIRRLEDFFGEEEQDKRNSLPPAKKGENGLSIHGDFTWNVNEPAYLNCIDLDAPKGSLVVIVGPTGAGKTSLTAAMLGLMEQVIGDEPVIRGKVALVPQFPFIFNASVRDNIIFGTPFDEQKYAQALDAACLETDLETLPGGDLTELGERGINVSGGQKQRIAIARAVYSGADVFILDDPLSALDAKVGRRVFNRCLEGAIADKTRIFVTNQLQFVSSADIVVFLTDGKVTEMGSYEELMSKNGPFSQMMSEAQVEEDVDSSEADEIDNNGLRNSAKPSRASSQSGGTSLTETASAKKAMTEGRDVKIVQRESRAKGVVSREVLLAYMKAMGGFWPFAFLMLQFICVEGFRVATNLWLMHWTHSTETEADSTDSPKRSQTWYMNIYTLISLGQVAFTLLNTLDLKWVSRVAADYLHKTMLDKLLKAPMSFFHTTPIGRVINRCTRDTSDVDKNLADYACFFVRSLLQLVTTVMLVGIFTPITLPCLVPILLLFYFLYLYFQTSVREIKRLDAVSRSPVYSSLNEAISGLPTVKAFGAEQRLIDRYQGLVNSNVRMNLVNQSMNRWLSIRLESLGAFAALFAGVLAVEQGGASAVVGLTLSYALQITAFTSMTVRLASLTENMFNAVERIVEYGNLEEEAEFDMPDSVPPEWPDKGGVLIEKVEMRYRPGLPLVLKGMSAVINGGEKIGVVGRTGAGKSSLINALFRLVELDSGKISIDGVDISKIGLMQLRDRIAIIPQAPVLFTGTIRSNLDPFSLHSDSQIWAALRRAHLDRAVSTSVGLDMALQEGGAPLSAGQKQLLTLTRALLTRSKILILDEATANVDVETDALIQKTIREEFADCTVIAIAHRLHTIIDCDKVLVCDRGQAAEFDSPARLLSNPDGVFTSMVRETGEATERFLRGVAFGEVDMEEIQAIDAAHGIEKLAHPVEFNNCVATVSMELTERAKAAVKTLKHVKEKLDQRHEQYRGVQEDPGKEAIESAGKELLEALKDALTIVGEVEAIAETADSMLRVDEWSASVETAMVEEVIAPGGEEPLTPQAGAVALKQAARRGWGKVRSHILGPKRTDSDASGLPASESDHARLF